MTFLDPRVTEGIDERQVNLELVQFTLDGLSSSEWSSVVRVREVLDQLVGCLPQGLNL